MIADYLLPGSVLVLKLMFKLFADQSPRLVDLFKALITFPIDMTFLAFSFGAATLAHADGGPPNVKTVIALVLGGVICAFLTTKLCRLADGAFDRNRLWQSGFLAVIGYVIAAAVVYSSLAVGALA